MAEIRADGYIAIRTFITSNWKQVLIFNDLGEEVKRLSVDDNKVKWTHEKETREEYVGNDKYGRPIYDQVEYESNQELELTINLTGADFTLPATISKCVIRYEDKEISSENFQPFTFETANDQLTIKHKIQVPAVG